MDADQARSQLEVERTRLDGIRQGFIDDGLTTESEDESLGDSSHLNQHQADTGTETFERERDISILEQVEAELADVDHALKRLDEGSYGTCEACGRPIGDERLSALPATRFCLDDQAGAERDARSSLDRP
jgi:RNA polymerase-binding transcription factor DksA